MSVSPVARPVELTEEQARIVGHPEGRHAKALAVAGSGKTTTLARRVRYLLQERQVDRSRIRVLMFNHLARRQFKAKLAELGVPPQRQPPVDTFHSLAYGAVQREQFKEWFGSAEELARIALLRAVERVRQRHGLEDDGAIDTDGVEQAVQLWKSALIPPARAGYHGLWGELYVESYAEYEAERLAAQAVTFDDFVPLAVDWLQTPAGRQAVGVDNLRHIIVDEYQDVNLGQQKLVELLASGGADVMAVGDDDQTIYEWRGARTDYILGEFAAVFDNKPHDVYRLTGSFRFGYEVAQAALNLMQHNPRRLEKRVLSVNPRSPTPVLVVEDEPGGEGTVNGRLAEEALALVMSGTAAPADLRVLGRTYAQLNGLCSEFLFRRIPFKVEGGPVFLQASESLALLDYLRTALALETVPGDLERQHLVNIANKPRRFLARRDLERLLREGAARGATLGGILAQAFEDGGGIASFNGVARLGDLLSLLTELRGKLLAEPLAPAGELLRWVDTEAGYREHYEHYYGRGELSATKISTVEAFVCYAERVGLDWKAFIAHVEGSDTTLGRPEAEWVRLSTVHRSKGLEYDYVIIPDCVEGFMPVAGSDGDPTYDTAAPTRMPRAAEWLENERRLFYVAVTRARKGLYIGAPTVVEGGVGEGSRAGRPSRFIEELELGPTQEVAAQLNRALAGEPSRLAAVCRRLWDYHGIVRPVKEVYADLLPLEVQEELRAAPLARVERTFRYCRQYDGPKVAAPPAQGQPGLWSHLEGMAPGPGVKPVVARPGMGL